jgi:hypothetical protein
VVIHSDDEVVIDTAINYVLNAPAENISKEVFIIISNKSVSPTQIDNLKASKSHLYI